jgi:hypothetical protein
MASFDSGFGRPSFVMSIRNRPSLPEIIELFAFFPNALTSSPVSTIRREVLISL